MNIWMINHHALKTGRHVFFAAELAKRGYHTLLFTAGFSHYTFQETRQYARGKFYDHEKVNQYFERVWIKTPPYFGNSVKRVLNQLIFTIRVIRAPRLMQLEKPHLVIGSSVHLFAALAGYRLALRYRVPFFFEVRDLWPQTLVDMGALKEKGLLTWFFRRLERFLYQKADRVISVLPDAVKYIQALGIDAEKVVYLPNGISLPWFDRALEKQDPGREVKDFFSTINSSTINSSATDNQKLIFTYCGAMGEVNGLDTVVEAAIRLRDQAAIHFLLVGDGPQKKELLEQVKAAALDNISFIGMVDRDQVPYILNNSHASIFHLKKAPVFKYGVSSNKLFDYLAARKPVIYAVESSNNFVLQEGCGISIAPEDPEAMAGAVLKLARMSPGEHSLMGEKGRKYVEEHHEFEILGERLSALIAAAVDCRL